MSDPQELIEFLHGILAGGIVLDRQDPSHLQHLREAIRLLQDYERLSQLIPEMPDAGSDLGSIEDFQASISAETENLINKISLLEELHNALEGHIGGMRGRVERLRTAPPEGSVSEWADPAAEAFAGVVAIDVGTSNVACAHWNFHHREPQIAALEPAAVNVIDAQGFRRLLAASYLTGEGALEHKNQINLYRSFRRLLGTQQTIRPAVTGSELVQVQVKTLVGAVVTALLRSLVHSLGHQRMRFPQVVVTVPASGDLALEYELRRVFQNLEVPLSTDLDEATAACIYYLLRPVLLREFSQLERGGTLTPGQWYAQQLGLTYAEKATMNVLCIDQGGGTTDLSLLEFLVQEDDVGCEIDIDVRDTTGFRELNGEGLTLHLFRLLKRRLALALLHPRLALAGTSEERGPPTRHPWQEYHQLEAGPADMSVERRLEEDQRLLLQHWDKVAGDDPLRDDLKAAVDRLFPTVTKGVPKSGRRFRAANFRWLWDQAERLKRVISAERASYLSPHRLEDDPIPTVRSRLDLSSYKQHPHGVDLLERLRLSKVDPNMPLVPEALSVSSKDIDRWVSDHGEARLLEAIHKLCKGQRIHRVLLAGNATHATRYVVEKVVRRELGLAKSEVVFDPGEAKQSVAKGACLWAIGNKLEGIQVFLNRQPRCPTGLWLTSAVSSEPLFAAGQPINRFSYCQPPHREGAEGDKLILIAHGERELEPFLIFDPRKGVPLRELGDLPILQRQDVLVRNVDRFMGFQVKGNLTEFYVKDPAQYVQMDEAFVSQVEIFEQLRLEMTMEEVITWLESSEHLKIEPPAGHAFHRYYMDEDRQLYLVFHAQGRKLLCRATVTDHTHVEDSEARDPFSGIH